MKPLCKQKLLITSLLLACMQTAYSQVLPTLPPKKSDTKPAAKPKTKSTETTQTDYNTQTIKFTTDAECDIFIDGEAKGHIQADGVLKVKLAKGQYLFKVTGANTADQIKETLNVDETGTERLYQVSLQIVIDRRIAVETTTKQAEQQRQAEQQKQAELQKQAEAQKQAEQQRLDQIQKQVELKENATISHKEEMEKLNYLLVQSGTFNMGGSSAQNFNDEKPVHQVFVSSFYISKYEVTVADFRKFIQATGYITKADQDGKSWVGNGSNWKEKKGVNWQCDEAGNRRGINEDNQPVIHIDWDDCEKYCQWMSQQTGKQYRLPTEAEWEYAARGGNRSNGFTYSGSNNIDDVGWYKSNSGGKTHQVGMKKPNELGVYDMTGNVWEWCSDWYEKDYYSNSPVQNPQGPITGTYRVIRGGGWNINLPLCRTAHRNRNEPGNCHCIQGFRPVVSF